MAISKKIKQLQNRIAAISTQPVKLVAVTKNRRIEEIHKAIAAGIEIIGENRIQEAEKKFPFLANPIKKHFIGHLQTNKVKKALQLFDVIQSVDSITLAEKINKEAEKRGKRAEIFLQINISRDPAKYGFLEKEIHQAIKDVFNYSHIEISGLMTILEHIEDRNRLREDFHKMKEMFDTLRKDYPNLKNLSMGMSDDYIEALQEGSNMLRIGRHIFTN